MFHPAGLLPVTFDLLVSLCFTGVKYGHGQLRNRPVLFGRCSSTVRCSSWCAHFCYWFILFFIYVFIYLMYFFIYFTFNLFNLLILF